MTTRLDPQATTPQADRLYATISTPHPAEASLDPQARLASSIPQADRRHALPQAGRSRPRLASDPQATICLAIPQADCSPPSSSTIFFDFNSEDEDEDEGNSEEDLLCARWTILLCARWTTEFSEHDPQDKKKTHEIQAPDKSSRRYRMQDRMPSLSYREVFHIGELERAVVQEQGGATPRLPKGLGNARAFLGRSEGS
ncbi:hypothetical protein BDZ89DRAFT_1121698 [Hymenopellis radicata]|nr:hypothetical protein BDZ89DRAFT_1121698 [Hymenopellis radicata]